MPIQKPFAVVPHPLGTITTGNERTNRPASHLGIFKSSGLVWQSTGSLNLWVRGDFGSSKDIDFVALLGTNALGSTEARLRLGDTQAEVDGTADYDSGVQRIITPVLTRKDGKYHWHWELPSTFSKRWWRLDISFHSGDFQAMALVLGQKLQFADFYNQTGFGFGMEDMAGLEFGRYGVVDAVDGIKLRTLDMEFGWMSDSDRFTKFQPLREEIGTTGFAYWSFDSDATVQRQDKTYFGRLTKPPYFKPSTFKQNVWQSQWSIQSII